MNRLIRPWAVSALALCFAVFAAAEPVPQGPLPRWAVPQSYKLAFKLDPAQPRFAGTTTIKLDLKQVADHLWLNGRDLTVSKVVISDAQGKTYSGKYVVAASREGVARIDFGSTLPAQLLTLTIDYTAPFNEQLQGLYKVSRAGVPYAMTQMEPISARFAFPGFDEPDFKTPYDISLTVPSDLVAVANTRQIAETPAGDRWKTVRFERTRPLPTYLVAFAVGPWDVVNGPDILPNAYRGQALPLHGLAAHGEGHRLQHVLSETPAIIHTLEDYYGFGYPFGKLDLLAAPDFSAGAMENPGLLTFRDWLLLLDASSPAQYVRDSFNVTAHELAHQWTGDVVTLTWWDDLWLNEAFATWMQGKVTMKLHPPYRADLDRIIAAEQAMQNDSLVSARKIRQPITSQGDIETAFDSITYSKGAAVLGMFEGYVGEDLFRQGMRAYMEAHKYGNATVGDLLDTMAAVTKQGQAFKQAFYSFLNQSGVPYVQASLEEKNGKTLLHLSQSRYLPVGSTGEASRVWGIPMCVRYSVPSGSKVKCEMFNQASGSMALEGASPAAWVMPNAYARGYYRFSMSAPQWHALTQHVAALSDAEQLAYADSIDAGFRHGELDAGEVLAALQSLAKARTCKVMIAPLHTVAWIYRYGTQTDAQRANIAAWVKRAYLPRLERLGLRRKPGEAEEDALLRTTLAQAMALRFELPQVRAALLQQGDAALTKQADGRLDLKAADPNLLGAALSVAVQERGKRAVDALIGELPTITDPAMRNAILAGLSAATTPEVADEARDFALSKQVKVGEMATVLRGGHDTPAARDALWHWFTGHYQAVLARTDTFGSGYLPQLMGGGSCSRAEADRMQAFFQPRLKDIAGADRGLAQTREQTLLCAALKAKQDVLTKT